MNTAATKWGLSKESVALKKYKEFVIHHDDDVVEQCSVSINVNWPHLAASPDSLVNCRCCG